MTENDTTDSALVIATENVDASMLLGYLHTVNLNPASNNPPVNYDDQGADLPIVSSPCEGVIMTENDTTDSVIVIATENVDVSMFLVYLHTVNPNPATNEPPSSEPKRSIRSTFNHVPRDRDATKPTPVIPKIRKSVPLAEKVASWKIPPAVHVNRFHNILMMYEKLYLGLRKRSKSYKRLRLRKGIIYELIANSHDPATLKQIARAIEDASLWGRGIFKELSVAEIQSLRREKVKILKSKYVSKKFIHADRSLKKFYVRLCVRGDLQYPSIHTDVYADIVQCKAVFLLLAIANQKDLEVATANITSAFLYPEFIEELCLELSDGRIIRLLRALYGLRQAANAFLNYLKDKLENIGFKQMISDTCIFYLDERDAFVILATHVDDLLCISNS